jgi:endogenous inhibitor of DNA gyrase (YacG/DUF329 family)
MTKSFPDPPSPSLAEALRGGPRRRTCPRCDKPVATTRPLEQTEAAKVWPFCSTRCRWADLSAWLDGSYRIAGEELASADAIEREPPD